MRLILQFFHSQKLFWGLIFWGPKMAPKNQSSGLKKWPQNQSSGLKKWPQNQSPNDVFLIHFFMMFLMVFCDVSWFYVKLACSLQLTAPVLHRPVFESLFYVCLMGDMTASLPAAPLVTPMCEALPAILMAQCTGTCGGLMGCRAFCTGPKGRQKAHMGFLGWTVLSSPSWQPSPGSSFLCLFWGAFGGVGRLFGWARGEV